MKIFSTSDWHIGNFFHGNDRLEEHRHFFGWLLDKLKEHRPDALLVAGDVFDTANPSAAAQSVYYEFLADATKACPEMKIIISSGNHDSAYRLEAPRALLACHNVEVRGAVKRKWVHDDEKGFWATDYDDLIIPLQGKDGEQVVVLAVPYLRTDTVDGKNYSEGVNNFIRELTQKARKKHPQAQIVMMAHLYAKGSEIAANDASEKIQIGGLEEVNMDGWEERPDYLTSGHIHKRQHIWNTDWARYTGSVLPMSFAEVDYRHGVDLLTVSSGKKPKVEFLEYQPQHKLLTLPKDGEELTPPELIKLIKKELPGRGENDELGEDFVYVQLKVKMDRVNNDEIKKMESAVAEKNAVLCKTQRVLTPVDNITIGLSSEIASVEDILNRNPLDTLKETFMAKHGRDMNENQEKMLESIIATLAQND